MSYIYDALKRAERDNQRRTGVTLRSVEAAGPPRRSRWWLWVLIGALAANAGAFAAFVVMRQPPPVETSPVAAKPAPVASAPTAPTAPRPTAPVVEPTRSAAQPEPPKAAVAVEPPKVAAPAVAPKRVAPAPAAGPSVTKAEPVIPREAPPAAKLAPTREPAPAPTVSSPGVEPRSRTAQRQPSPAAAPVVPATGASPAVAAVPATSIDPPKLALQVIAYSDVAAERMVFIDGRRYGEGDAIDPETVLQRIKPDSIVVKRRGQEFVIADRPR